MATLDRFRTGRAAQPSARWSRPAARRSRDLSIQPPDGTRPVRLLSGGNQQKVLLGKWLNLAPRIIILDEPTVGVDVGAKAEIYAILRARARPRRGRARRLVRPRGGDDDRRPHRRHGRRAASSPSMTPTRSTWPRSSREIGGRRHEHGARQRRRPALARRIGPNALPIAILVIVIVFAIAQPAFLKPDNLIGIVRQVALVGIMATCMTFVIMTGGVDLSVGPVLALGGLVCLSSAWQPACRFPS